MNSAHNLAELRSRLLRYLPAIYAGDPFLEGLLCIFESIWEPLERQIDQLHTYSDPRLAPAEFLPWLGTWVDLVLDETWPEPRRRLLIQHAAELYRRRGTKGALTDYLALYTGLERSAIAIADLDELPPFSFRVTLTVAQRGDYDEQRIRQIIDEEKPAHTAYTLEWRECHG